MKRQFISYSGGKDSTALALLYPDAIPVFTDTGMEFPEMYEQINKFESITGREIIKIRSRYGTLRDYILDSKFLPGHGARYCTRIFKIQTFDNWIKATFPGDDTIELMIGLRWDEQDRRGNFSKLKNVEYTYPLRDYWQWRISDVLRICLQRDLLPRYPVYMARGGCMNCFYKGKQEIIAMAHLKRDVLEDMMAIEETVQDKRGRFAYMYPNIGMSIRNFINLIDNQHIMFDVEGLYAQTATKRGRACGLFCNR